MENNFYVWIILLVTIVFAAVGVVLFRRLIVSVIMLALVSATMAVALFIMGFELAAIMELSVCSGLVTAMFVTSISLTKTGRDADPSSRRFKHYHRFLPLPFILALLAAGIILLWPDMDVKFGKLSFADVSSSQVLWSQRSLDVLALALIILAGVLGVSVLFREKEEK